jgi:hypothetical protein
MAMDSPSPNARKERPVIRARVRVAIGAISPLIGGLLVRCGPRSEGYGRWIRGNSSSVGAHADETGDGSDAATHPIEMLSTMAGASSPAVGWAMHFMLGTVLWGLLFAWLEPKLRGESHWVKGMAFGIGTWLLMMIIVMPMAGAGLFGMQLGMMAPIMTLVLHLVFGAVLGGVYGAQKPALAHPVLA